MQGAGNLVRNNIPTESVEPILAIATEHFIKVLESEIHEKVLCHALEMFSWWARGYRNELPKKITDTFKKGVEAKTVTHTVRVAYLQWLLAALENATLPAGIDLSSALLSSVEKASQNATQIPLVSEAVCSACLILKTESSSVADGTGKLQSFWNIVLDMTKQLFVTEKFLTSAPIDTQCYVALYSKILIIEHLTRLRGGPEPLYKAIVYALTSQSKKVRAYTLPLVKDLILTAENPVVVIKNLLQQLTSHIQTTKVVADAEAAEEGSIPAPAIVDAVETLCCSKILPNNDAQAIALSSLLCSHHPLVVNTRNDLWEHVLTSLQLDPKSFISLNTKQIKASIIEVFKPVPLYENCVSSIAKLSPDIILPLIIKQVTEQLSHSEMSNVSDEEYFTYLTPDGELYDKSVIPNTDDIYKDLSKKRENKVYTYKEQLEEIQLRREIEEKKRKDGTWKPPQLTQKQQEAIKNQTEKERAIKERLNGLNTKILSIVSLIKGVLNGNPSQLQLHFAQLLPCILQVVKSPLAAESLTKLYYDLRVACFASNELSELGDGLAITTLRLHEPHCDLNAAWTKLEVNAQITATIQLMAKTTLGEDDTNLLTSPAFCYAFELLKKAVFNGAVTRNEELMLTTIQLIARHVQVQGNTVNGELTDYRHPKYLPRYELLKLLLDLITIHRGRVQSQAVSALLYVAKSSSGAEYVAKGDPAQIQILLNALQSNLDAVRDVALRALTIMVKAFPRINDDYEFCLELLRRLWIAKHDISDENKQLADELWTLGELEVPIVLSDELLRDVIHQEVCIQKASALALVSILKEDTTVVDGILDQLLAIYKEKLDMIPAQVDQFEREIVPAIDQWVPRRGVAISLCQIAQFFSLPSVDRVMQFMVASGLRDRDEIVHKEMLAAALAVVDLHGKETTENLLPVFERFLDKAPKTSTYDNVRQAVVILMGSLARNLDKEDERIRPIVKRLLDALSTPSQQVQEAVANCLPALMPFVKDDASQMVKKLMQQLVKSEKYGERRGAAYGIAGIVKGLGILSLKQLEIMTKLTQHIQEKKNYKSREGALFAFEMLCTTLGRLFEPYIVHVLPHLLQCFGDSSQYVRQAADDTAKVVMGKLSAHGVKLVLPSLLNALDEDSWRTKTASVELLGAMAYCAPKQLSSCLPSIVPKLIEVLGDSHTKVQEAGADALKVIGKCEIHLFLYCLFFDITPMRPCLCE